MVTVVCREHLPQLEKIQEVLCSSRDEAHFLCGVSRVITPKLWNFQRVLHTLATTQEVPRYTRLHSRGSTSVRPPPEELRFRLQARDEGSFPASSGKNSRRFRRISRGGALHRKGERNSWVVPPFQEPPDVSVHSRGSCFPCTASTFMPRIDSHHGGTWESPVGKPRGTASRESHRSLDPRDGKRDTAATAREESARACPTRDKD